MTDATPTKLGRYELGEIIGQGAMGVVYKAYDSFLDRVVAVKTYRQDIPFLEQARERFEREVRTASKLSHPNIVIVYDGGLEEGVPYLAMEFIDGPTLRDELTTRGRITLEETLAILFSICDGLAYAHARGVIHRDLKPANVLLAPGGVAKISDFGVAKLLGSEAATNTVTVGTPGYMAPEQIQGKPIGPVTDVFALGILAYELFSGVRPFQSDTAITLIYQILNTSPRPASEIEPMLPKAVDAVLARAMDKDPTKRTPDAVTFAAELSQAFELSGRPPPPPVERPRTHPAWFLIPILLLAAGGAAAYLFSRYGTRGDDDAVARVERTAVPLSPTAAPRPQEAASPAPPPTARLEPTAAEAPQETPVPPISEAPEAMPTTVPAPPEAPPIVVAPPVRAAPRAIPTAKPPAARARASSLEISSSPPNAEVRVDGEYKGVTPLRVSGLGAGSVWIELRKPGYTPYQKSVRIDNSSELTVRATLDPDQKAFGYVEVVSDPPGAEVMLNGAPSGRAPLRLGPLRTGRHEVTAQYPGFPKETQVIEMRTSEIHRLKFIFRSGRQR